MQIVLTSRTQKWGPDLLFFSVRVSDLLNFEPFQVMN